MQERTYVKPRAFRLRNEIDARDFFRVGEAVERQYEYQKDPRLIGYRFIGKWQQLWEGFALEPIEEQMRYEQLADEVWACLERGEMNGKILSWSSCFAYHYDLDRITPAQRRRTLATYLWAAMTHRIYWNAYGGRRPKGWIPSPGVQRGGTGWYVRRSVRDELKEAVLAARKRWFEDGTWKRKEEEV